MELALKTIIVTGSNKGIGYGIVRALLKLPYKIIMACRSIERAEKAKEELAENDEEKKSRIDILELDISKSESIDKFV